MKHRKVYKYTWLCDSCEKPIEEAGLCEECQLEHSVEWEEWLGRYYSRQEDTEQWVEVSPGCWGFRPER